MTTGEKSSNGALFARSKRWGILLCHVLNRLSTGSHVYALHPKKAGKSSQCLASHRLEPMKYLPVVVRNRQEKLKNAPASVSRPRRAGASRRERAAARKRVRRVEVLEDEEGDEAEGEGESSDGGSYVPSDNEGARSDRDSPSDVDEDSESE